MNGRSDNSDATKSRLYPLSPALGGEGRGGGLSRIGSADQRRIEVSRNRPSPRPTPPSTGERGKYVRAIAATCALACSLFSGDAVRGQENGIPSTAPAAAADADAAVVVTAVEGKARARTGPTAEWQLVTEGMRLPVGSEIATGPRARVKCSIPPGEEFVVDRMSTVTVLEAERRGGRQRTRLVMDYGRTAARVQAAGIEHDMQIQTPATTASVRGTEYTVYDQPPFAPELRTYTGLVDYRFAKRQLSVGKGGRSRGGRGAAETALLASVVDPSTANARTNADAALIANEVSRGAVLTYNPTVRLNEIRGGAGPQTDANLLSALPGRLNFVLRWDQNVDVDIFVTVQPGDQFANISAGTFNPQTFLYPGFGLERSPTGGRIPYNHRGGPNGGQEICFWPDDFPNAIYGFSALNNSVTDPVDVRFNAFLDGEKISLYTFDLQGNLIRTKGVRRTIPADGTESNLVLAPPNELFESLIPESPDETTGPAQGGGAVATRGTREQAAKPQTAKAQAAKARKQEARAARASAKAAAKAAKAGQKVPLSVARRAPGPKPTLGKR